jgi:FlaA1/EpsC-like NDP-sugar epimerase
VRTVPGALRVLGRPEAPAPVDISALPEGILITGAGGSIGNEIVLALREAGLVPVATDVEPRYGGMVVDVTDRHQVLDAVSLHHPELIIHMAGAKHAPAGEEDPVNPFRVHVDGTRNVLEAAAAINAHVVLASTCKACDPETAYGASKLIAERLVLNDRQSVVRFYNVVETSGNVFGIWNVAATRGDPLPVTPCSRRFITLNEAVALTLWAAVSRKPGRFMHWPTIPRLMTDIANDLHGGHPMEMIPPRRGDRMDEPEHARCESFELVDGSVVQVRNPHDV